MSVNQISVFLENRIGQLAEVTKLLAENEINLRAISIAETTDYGVIRIIVDDSKKASSVLYENGNIISMAPVLAVEVPDKPAGLNELLEILADGQIGIEYMYSLLAQGKKSAYMIFRVNDVDKFVSLLKQHNINIADSKDLGIK